MDNDIIITDDLNRCSKNDDPSVGPCMCPQCISDAVKADALKVEELKAQESLITDDPNRCSKNDEQSVGPCMCPQCMLDTLKPKEPYKPKGIVITDEHLVSPDPEHRVAWFFTCPNCQMKNVADYNYRCPDCGEIIIFRSTTVFNWLRNYNVNNPSKDEVDKEK